MRPDTGPLYRFEGFQLDPANRVVTGSGEPIALSSRAFDLLLYMARNAQRLLTKEELMKAVWRDTVVEEGNLTQSVFLLRKALSTSRMSGNKLILTVPGHGYRFAAPVEEIEAQPRGRVVEENLQDEPPALRPSVLPQATAPPNRSARLLLSGALAAIAVAALVLFVVRARWQSDKPIPMPHPVTRNAPENPVLSVAISPRGTYLAHADLRSVTIQTLRTGETRSLPLAPGATPLRVVWYPDETRLLLAQRLNDTPALYVFSILSGKLSPLRENGFAPAISPDGTRVAYVDSSIHALWLIDANGENPRQFFAVAAPDKLYPLFWSPDSRRVWFARVHWDKDKETVTLETCGVSGADRTVVLSNNRASAFRLLPRDRLIYAVGEGAQGFTNLWELRVGETSGKPDGAPRKLTDWTNFTIRALSSTADGKRLAILNGNLQSDVYVGDLAAEGTGLSNVRRLTLDEANDAPAFWTPDDQAVVFDSNRNGHTQLFRQRLDQTVPELLSMDSEQDEDPRFGSPWIYFRTVPIGQRISWNQPLDLRRIPIGGGASTLVMRAAGAQVGCADRRPEICALAQLTGKTLAFYRFSHENGKGAEIGGMEFDSRLFPSFAVSPDGTEIAVINPKGTGNVVRRIPLDGGAFSEVEVPGRKGFEALYWAADGKGWFVSSVTPSNGEYLLHVDLKGESQVLSEETMDGRDTWGVPSHDGKRLAFLRWTVDANVWMIDDF